MNAVGTYDEDPTELSIIGIGGSGSSGELGSGEKIYWVDTNQFIQGDTTSITIESDDTLTMNTDTLRVNQLRYQKSTYSTNHKCYLYHSNRCKYSKFYSQKWGW